MLLVERSEQLPLRPRAPHRTVEVGQDVRSVIKTDEQTISHKGCQHLPAVVRVQAEVGPQIAHTHGAPLLDQSQNVVLFVIASLGPGEPRQPGIDLKIHGVGAREPDDDVIEGGGAVVGRREAVPAHLADHERNS